MSKKETLPSRSNSFKEKSYKQLKAKLRKAILHKSPEEPRRATRLSKEKKSQPSLFKQESARKSKEPLTSD